VTAKVSTDRPASSTESVSLISAVLSIVAVSAMATEERDRVRVTSGLYRPSRTTYGTSVKADAGSTHEVTVITDPAKHVVKVVMDGATVLETPLVDGGPASVDCSGQSHSGGTSQPLSVVDMTASSPQPTLWQSLIH
jgi:cell wall-associated NlpC family hydrolase